MVLATRSPTALAASRTEPETEEAAEEAVGEAAEAAVAAALDALAVVADAALRAASAPVAAALFNVELATPMTSEPVVRVSSMVRPAPISNAGTGLARACSARVLNSERPLSFTRAMASVDSAEGARPSRNWPSVSASSTRLASASRCRRAVEVMYGLLHHASVARQRGEGTVGNQLLRAEPLLAHQEEHQADDGSTPGNQQDGGGWGHAGGDQHAHKRLQQHAERHDQENGADGHQGEADTQGRELLGNLGAGQPEFGLDQVG